MIKYSITIFAFTILINVSPVLAQAINETIPYHDLAAETNGYSSGAIASRMLDGLGFRFYWATDNLRQEDLDYRPGEDARTSFETITHVYEMSGIILNVAKKQPTVFPQSLEGKTFADIRSKTLQNIKVASDIIKTWKDSDFEQHPMVFKSKNGETNFPFWNLINGPISDCLWHVGQIVSFRRSSGNPFNEKVSVLSGKGVQ